MRKRLKYLLITLSVIVICTAAVCFTVSAASAMPSAGTASLKVIDISQWNDSVSNPKDDINFSLLKSQVDAVYIRAFGNSNGVPYIDMQAVRYTTSAQNVNLPYGFYYYYIPKADLSDAKSQAQAYYSFVRNYAYSCVPALDVEENPNNLSKPDLAASVKAFADEFKALSGFDLMIYSYPDFIKNNFDPAYNWSLYKLWIAHYNVSAPMEEISSSWMPQSKWCWERWDLWQYTSKGTLSSIPNSSGGSLDISQATDNILLSTPISVSNLEAPSLTAVNGGDISICGWALSHSGVSRVDIYADDFRWVGSASNMTERPDVQKAMNSNGRYNDGLHSGFSYTVDASFFTVGQHTLKIAVINRNQTVNWLFYTFTVGPESGMNLESPQSVTYGGDIVVAGWAVSHAAISRVDIYVDDNRWMGSTANIYARSDVNSAVNSSGLYKDGLHSGFSYTIDASLLSIGTHVIKVAAISKDGSIQWAVRQFTVGPESKMCLDSPSSGTNYGDISVNGWAVSHASITRVDIYVDDNHWMGSTSNMYVRSDVNSAVNGSGQYKDALHSGFSYTIDASLLAPGTHVVKVAAISKDGSVQWVVRQFTVGSASKMCLDLPGDVVTGNIAITGWALSNAGVSRVDIYADNNVWIGSTANMYERSDVNSSINSSGQYKDGIHSGFSYIIDTGILSVGTHVLKIAAISKDGTVQWAVKTITVQ